MLRWLERIVEHGAPIRPPGALLPDARFANACIRCRRCMEVCPYHSIKTTHWANPLHMGLPYVKPREVPCYLCMKCPPECPTGALQPIKEKEAVKMGVAVIREERCLAYNGIICRACYERCPIYREAVVLKDELFPVIVAEKCVGCGICENVCPAEPAAVVVRAPIEVRGTEVESE